MSGQGLPNRHRNEKDVIDRMHSNPTQQFVASFPDDTQIGVGCNSQKIFPSLLGVAPGPNIILPSEQLSRPGRTDIADLQASPLSSLSKIRRWSKRSSYPHSPRVMGGAETSGNPLARRFPSRPLDNMVTQSPFLIPMPHGTSSGSLIEPRRTEVTIALPSHKAESQADYSRHDGIPASPSTTLPNLRTDTSTSSPPFTSAVSSTKETTFPSAKSESTPISAGVAARSNPTELLDEALLVPPFMPLAIVPNVPRSFKVKRKPHPPRSNLEKPSPTSIIAGQTSTGTRGGCVASHSLMYEGVSKPSLTSSSMDRKVAPFPGREGYPNSSPSKPRSASTSSGSSCLTTGPTPQSDLPSPPSTRTCRLSMKRLLPKPAASPLNSRNLVKFPSIVSEESSVDRKTRPPKFAAPAAGGKCESGKPVGDQIRSSDTPGSDSGHSVYPQPPSSSILSIINKVLRSNDVVPLKEHHPSIPTGGVHSSRVQPDVQAFPTNSRDPSSVCETGNGAKGLSPPGRNRKFSKGEEMVNNPTRRRRNVLRKRSNPCMIGLSRSTSTLGSSRSPSEGHTKDEEPVHRNRRLHDIDRISFKHPQSVLERSEVGTPHPRTGIFDGSLTASQLPGMKDVGLLTSVHEVVAQRDFALERPRKRRQEDVGDAEGLTPAALIAMECKAKMSEASGNAEESHVVSDLQRDGTTIRDRSLVRSASLSDILFSSPVSVYGQLQHTEKIYSEGDKRARQSLNLSITMRPKELDDDKLRKSVDMVTSKTSGGRLRRLMRKFSLSRSGGKRDEQTPMAVPSLVTGDQSSSRFRAETRSLAPLRPSRLSISSPETSSAVQTAPKSSPPDEIPPLPRPPVSVPLDLHIVNPSVLDQTCHEEEDQTRTGRLQNLSVLPPSSSPKVPEGEWIRSNSPDLELAALPLPPRRASKVSTGPPPQSGVEADDTNVIHPKLAFVPVISDSINPQTTLATFPLRSDSLNFCQPRPVASISSTKNSANLPIDVPTYGSAIPSISVSRPPHRPLTKVQRPGRKREDTHPRLDPPLQINIMNNLPPLHRKHSFQDYSSEARNTSSNHTIAQPMPVRKSMPIVEDPPVRAEETDPNSNSYFNFTRSSLSVTPSVVFRPGTANTFGGSEILGSDIRPGTSDSAISTTERVKSYSPLAGSSLRLAASPTSSTSTESR